MRVGGVDDCYWYWYWYSVFVIVLVIVVIIVVVVGAEVTVSGWEWDGVVAAAAAVVVVAGAAATAAVIVVVILVLVGMVVVVAVLVVVVGAAHETILPYCPWNLSSFPPADWSIGKTSIPVPPVTTETVGPLVDPSPREYTCTCEWSCVGLGYYLTISD